MNSKREKRSRQVKTSEKKRKGVLEMRTKLEKSTFASHAAYFSFSAMGRGGVWCIHLISPSTRWRGWFRTETSVLKRF